MSDHANRTTADRRLTADELAAAIREGVETRDWRFDPPRPPFPTPDIDPTAHMPAVSNLTAPMPLPAGTRFRSRFRRKAFVYLSGLLAAVGGTADPVQPARPPTSCVTTWASGLAERNDEAVARLTGRVDELTRLYFEATRRLDELSARVPAK